MAVDCCEAVKKGKGISKAERRAADRERRSEVFRSRSLTFSISTTLCLPRPRDASHETCVVAKRVKCGFRH